MIVPVPCSHRSMGAQCVKWVINLGGPLARIRLSDPSVKERLQDLLIDAYLATLVDVHADGCVHAVMVVGVTGRSDPDRIRVYTLVVGWPVPVSQAPCGPWRARP